MARRPPMGAPRAFLGWKNANFFLKMGEIVFMFDVVSGCINDEGIQDSL